MQYLGYVFLTDASSSLVYVLDENEVDEDLKVIFKVSIPACTHH